MRIENHLFFLFVHWCVYIIGYSMIQDESNKNFIFLSTSTPFITPYRAWPIDKVIAIESQVKTLLTEWILLKSFLSELCVFCSLSRSAHIAFIPWRHELRQNRRKIKNEVGQCMHICTSISWDLRSKHCRQCTWQPIFKTYIVSNDWHL